MSEYQGDNYREFRNESHTAFFAAYLNLARNNAYRTLIHISAVLDIEQDSRSGINQMCLIEKLNSSHKEELSLGKLHKITKQLGKHFPFFSVYFDEIKKQKQINTEHWYYWTTKVFHYLTSCRNFYTHPGHESLTGEEDKELLGFLENIFTASACTVKDRFDLPEQDMRYLRRKTKNPKGKGSVPNPQFRHEFQTDGKITEKGFAFFICLFLSRKESQLFLKKLKGFKSSRTPAEKASLEAYSVYRVQLPKMRINMVDTGESLAMDMLEELHRCPKELFPFLSREDQNIFRVSLEEDENNSEPEVLKKRYKNRFPAFALRWLDLQEALPSLRFQVNLGQYYFRFYQKNLIDGSLEPRSLSRRINAFGRPAALSALKETQWKDRIIPSTERKKGDNTPYITDSRPHYLIQNKQVGIKFCTENPSPELPVISFQGRGAEPRLEKPDCWLSIHELPALIFYTILAGGKQSEELIKQYHKKITNFFKRTAQGSIPKEGWEKELGDISPAQIPKAIRGYFQGKKVDQEKYQAQKLKTLREQNAKKKNELVFIEAKIKEKKFTAGKNKEIHFKTGKWADFLARDLLKLQESQKKAQGKDKITSLNFQILQGGLAFYGREKANLPDIFRRAGLIDSDNPHPFLKNLIASHQPKGSTLMDFVRAYLREKEEYLENLAKKNDYRPHFLRPRRSSQGKGSIQQLAAKLAESEPVNLPRGLFLKALREHFSKGSLLKDIFKTEESGKRANTVYLVTKYFDRKYKDSSQLFYTYSRNYPLEKKINNYRIKDYPAIRHGKELKDWINSPAIKQKGESVEKNLKRLYRELEKDEKTIRSTKIQDILLFLMVGKIITLGSGKLGEINPKSYQEFLSKNDHFSLPLNLPKNKFITIKDASLKLKNLGSLKSLGYDPRVSSLVEKEWYKNKQAVVMKELQEELEYYDSVREEFFALFHAFERKVVKKFPGKFKKETKGGYYNFTNICDSFFGDLPDEEKFKDKEKLCESIKEIRTAFCHNRYPSKKCFSGDNLKDIKNRTIVEALYKEAQCHFSKALSYLS